MNTKEILTSSLDDLVFELRNKNYGAYILRRVYQKNVLFSSLIASSLFLIFVATPYLVALCETPEVVKVYDVGTVDLQSLKPEEPKPPVIVEPPPPIRSTIQFTEPQPTPDDQVTDNRVVTQDDLANLDISNQTQVGDSTGRDLSLDDTNTGPIVTEDNTVRTWVDQMPEFPGGQEELYKFLALNIRYPEIAAQNDIHGQVVIEFVVNKNGEIGEVKVIKGIGFGCDQEAIRVIKSMPHWKPGKQNGHEVNVSFRVPVKFVLAN